MMPDLRARLRQLGMTQTALAGLLGVTTRAVQKWCAKGEAPQVVEMLLEAAEELSYIGKPAETLALLNEERMKRRTRA